jgi:hypothetical protein
MRAQVSPPDAIAKSIVNAITLAPSRFTMIETVIWMIESIRHDFAPDLKTWECFEHLLIIRRMWAVHRHGGLSSAAGIAQLIGMPRSTVQRRLRYLEKIGAVDRRGTRYAIVPDFINSPHGVEGLGVKGFRRRVKRWGEADKKMVIVGD